MRIVRVFICVILAVMFALWPPFPEASGGERIVVAGSTSLLPLTQRAAELFMKQRPDARIAIGASASADGINGLLEGTVDIAAASRPMNDREKRWAEEHGIEVRPHRIARDIIIPIVSPSNPVDGLTLRELRDIFIGKIVDWKDIGGPGGRIVIVSRSFNSGTMETFRALVLKTLRMSPDARMLSSNAAVAQAVSHSRFAIGYIAGVYLNEGVKALKVDGVPGSLATVKDGTYPLSRDLFLYTRRDPSESVTSFLQFILGPAGRGIMKSEGFIPID